MLSRKNKIALVGCGTVGGATANLLLKDRELLAARTGQSLDLAYIVDQDYSHAKELGFPASLFERDLQVALDDPEVGIVVELVGGTTVAKEITERALEAGKHVVTANKALLAHHGADLIETARANKVTVSFEASCAGGIPVIRALYDGLVANRIEALYGIVNGTCNYILTEMVHRGATYADALKAAQRNGLAEADPTLDVSGLDSAHKIAIMAALAFQRRIDFDAIPVQGIDTLHLQDVMYADRLGYVVKLLAIAHQEEAGISIRVRPSFISREHPLAWVSGPFNAVSIYGHATGHTMYYGRGAGGMPTASAVVSDIAGTAAGIYSGFFENRGVWPDQVGDAHQLSNRQITSRYYVRIMVSDSPGTLAQISSIFGNHRISIASVLQEELTGADESHGEERQVVPVVITVHESKEANMLAALDEIDSLDAVAAKSVMINIVDEHPESLG
jgi:homoserine dehydrogenase